MPRALLVLSTIAIGFAAAGDARAQYYPPAPVPSDTSYRVAPVPYGMDAEDEPDDYPYLGRSAPPRYRPAPPRAWQPREPYDPRYEERTGSLPPVEARPPLASAPMGPREPYYGPPPREGSWSARPPGDLGAPRPPAAASAPPGQEVTADADKEVPERFRRQLVDYTTKEPAGTIVIDTANTYLYLVRGNGKAIRYGIGVGREGFTWSGKERVSRMAEWPDWHPPAEMIERQPYLPRFMAGGPGNPLGARALYLGKTIYRIHGTNEPHTIGKFVSSGCIRMLNEDVEDLYQRINVGTQVVVLPGKPPSSAARDQQAEVSASQLPPPEPARR